MTSYMKNSLESSTGALIFIFWAIGFENATLAVVGLEPPTLAP